MSDDLELAVEVALATGRPLLVRGDPGSGKSSLAAYVARQRNWRYYEHVMTSRTTSQDLLWTFDPVRRFADSMAVAMREKGVVDEYSYVSPGPLWWAFDRGSAQHRGAGPDRPVTADEPLAEINTSRADGSVVLIDEIDKADPDVPNGLLVALGSGEFTVSDTGTRVRRVDGGAGSPLIIITTNGERELPDAFLRRCATVSLAAPEVDRLVGIATAHLEVYGDSGAPDRLGLARAIAEEVVTLRKELTGRGRRAPSTAEFLDALQACVDLGINTRALDPEDPENGRWNAVRALTLVKPEDR